MSHILEQLDTLPACVVPSMAARVLGIGEQTIRRWSAVGIGPPLVRLGPRKCWYDRGQFIAWVRERLGPELADKVA